MKTTTRMAAAGFCFLKNCVSEGGKLRNSIMPGENVSNGFFVRVIKIGKNRKNKRKLILEEEVV